MTLEEGWRRLAAALATRPTPPLVPERPWPGLPELEAATGDLPAELRAAAAVIGDRPEAAAGLLPAPGEGAIWRAIALRRAGRFPEARRAFRELPPGLHEPRLLEQALALLRAPGPGFRWSGEAAAHLAARGRWDPVWFVDACAAVDSGLLSRETAALLEEIQRAELSLLVEAGGAH